MIYVKIKRQQTLKKFLTLLFSFEKNHYLLCVETFKDKKYSKTQCEAGRYRCIDEILEIVNTYYPSITIKKLCKVLFNLELKSIKHNGNYKLYLLHCHNIDRTVMLFANFSCTYNIEKKGDSKWSSKELFEMSKS